MQDRRSTHIVVSIFRYHVMFCSKYRRKVLVPPRDEPLKMVLAEQIEQ